MSRVPQTAAVAKNTTINAEPAPIVESVSENKRKLSVSEDVGASKKIKKTAADETVPHRYLARFWLILGIVNIPVSWPRTFQIRPTTIKYDTFSRM